MIRTVLLRMRSVWPWLLVVGLALPIVRPFWLEAPFSHDHPVRIYQAWNFWTEMLGKGQLRGWSPYYGFGYPAGELYPFGAEAWVALVRVLTFCRLDWLHTYGAALAGALVFASLAMFSFTRRQFGTAAGVIAAILSLTDPGGWAEGGWYWHTEFGVWPVTFAMGIVLFALGRLSDLLVTRRPRDIPIAGALIAISLLTHLLPLTVYPLCVPLLLLDRRLRDGRLASDGVAKVSMACAIGFGLAAFSVIPMMARTSLTLDLGVQGIPVEQMGKSLASGSAFIGMWPPLFALGVIGGLFALCQPKEPRSFAPLATLVALLLSTNWLVHDLYLEQIVSGLIKVEAHRFVLVAKLFFYPLIGHAIVTLTRLTLLTTVVGRPTNWRRRVAIGLSILALLPVAYPTGRALYMSQVFKAYQSPEETRNWRDMNAVFEWTNAQRRASTEFYRVAYSMQMHDHVSGIAPMFDRTMMYKVGYTPAGIFNRVPMAGDPELLTALSVKYVVSETIMNSDDFTLERSFGDLKLYRFKRYRADPFVLVGAGHGNLLGFESERIRIQLSGVTAQTRLKLNVANFPAWQATLNGVEVPITTATVHEAEYPMLMEVPVARDGVLEFRYVRRFVDRLGLGVTLATLALLALAVAVGPGFSRAPRLARVWARARSAAGDAAAYLGARWAAHSVLCYALSIGMLVVVGLVLWRRAKPPLPAESLFRTDAPMALSLGDTPCHRAGFAAYRCGDHVVEATVRSGLYGAHVCMHAPFGPLVVQLNTNAPRFVAGRYDTESGSGSISLSAGEREVGTLRSRDPSQGLMFFQFDTRPENGKPTSLKIQLNGAPLHCFDLSLVP